MTGSSVSENTLARYFLIAYLLAGDSAEAAALLEDVAYSWKQALNDEQEFLMGIVRVACRRNRNLQPKLHRSDYQVRLPRELEDLLSLPTLPRYCLALRLCERISISMCAQLLELTVDDVRHNIRLAVIQLSQSQLCA